MKSQIGEKSTADMRNGVWFVYDGGCPICCMAAQALQIKKAVGKLHLVNAREDKGHPILKEVNNRGLDLDAGQVLVYQDSYYHGEDALHMMALLGSAHGWFNRANALLFRSKLVAKFCYPLLRAIRNTLLRFKGVQKIRNLTIVPDAPLFKQVFGKKWDELPTVLKNHYAVRPFSKDVVRVTGHLDINTSRMVSVLAKLTGMLLSYSGKEVPVTVVFRSGSSGAFHFERTFHFPDQGDVIFHSRMEWVKDNILVEFMRFGIGWKLAYKWDGKKVIMLHKGYVVRILGKLFPLPLALILGKGYAEEVALSDDVFGMWTHVKHPWFGITFGYAGEFKIVEISCDPS